MLAVIALHTGLLPIGWMGVWLFYVISGYVVTKSIMRGGTEERGAWLRSFYAKRFARIVPIYALYVVVAAAVAYVATGHVEPLTLISLLFFFFNTATLFGYDQLAPLPVSHLWTISVEMQFYAVYGLLFVFLARTSLRRVLVAMLVLAPVARAAATPLAEHLFEGSVLQAFAIYTTSFLHFDAFAAGALLALGGLERARERGALPLLFWAGIGALGLYFLVYVGVNAIDLGRTGPDALRDVVSGVLFGQGRQIWLYSALAAANVGLVAWTATGRAPWQRVVAWRPLQWIGEISYGAYIFQALAIEGIFHTIGVASGDEISPLLRPIVFVAAAALAIAAAALSSRYIEKPCIRLLSARRAQPRPA